MRIKIRAHGSMAICLQPPCCWLCDSVMRERRLLEHFLAKWTYCAFLYCVRVL